MTIRSDVSVDFTVSPRIITVAAPSTSITMQDLLDTLRSIEDDVWNMRFPKLVDSAGKTQLKVGKLTGITVTLQNALLAFEARVGLPYVQCFASDGNLAAVDEDGVALSTPISPTAFTQIVVEQDVSAALLNNNEALAADIWDKPLSEILDAGSIGQRVKQLLRLAEFLALKD